MMKFWFRAGVHRLILFCKPLIRCALNRTAVTKSSRLRYSDFEIRSALDAEDDHRAKSSFFTDDESALHERMQSLDKKVTNIKDKMTFPLLLKCGASIKLLVGK